MGCIGILAASAMLSSCSSDDEGNGGSTTEYKWTTNGGLKACDHILFETDNKENANGTQIGNGDQEFVFTGKQTLKKALISSRDGYISQMALNSPSNQAPSSRATNRARQPSSQSVAVNSSPKVQQQSLSSSHLKKLQATESLATGVVSSSAVRLRTTRHSNR